MKVLEDEGRDREKHLFRCLLLMPAELVDIAHDASFAPFLFFIALKSSTDR